MRLQLTVLCCLSFACRQDDDDGVPSETGAVDLFAAEPAVTPPETLVGGARRVVVEALEPAELTLQLDGPGGIRTVTWPADTSFDVPLVGLRAQAAHTLTLTLASDGTSSTRTVDVTGDTAPPNLPQIDVLTLDPTRVSGHTLFAASSPSSPGAWLLLLDAEGVPVWWSFQQVRLGGLELTDDGTLLGLGDYDILELDWLGETVMHLTSRDDGPGGIPVPDASFLHHEVLRTDDGRLLALDHVALDVPDLPADYDDLGTLGPATIADDRVLELDDAGNVLQAWSLAERLPTSRISFDSLEPAPALGTALDWAHANAIEPDDDGGMVVSLRHQDALVKLDAKGDVAWILGDPAGWPSPWSDQLLAADGPVVWPYHQHAPELRREADGLHVLLFDNVNQGHTPYTASDGERPSRLVEYVVDEVAGTVRQAWSFELDDEGPLAAIALGDADHVADGHVLGVWGLLTAEDGTPNGQRGRGNLSARIAEVDPTTDTVVFDLRIGSIRSTSTDGWSVYRAARLPRLHPQATSE